MAALRDAGPDAPARRRPRPGQRLHARPARLLRALRRADRLGDGHPEPARAVAGRAGAGRRPPPRRRAHHARGRLRRAVPRRRAARATRSRRHDHRGFRPEGWVERGRERLERMRPVAERARPDAAAARVPVEPRARAGALRRADADPGGRRRTRSRSRPSARSSPRCPAADLLSEDDVAELRAIGDNTGSMALKGAAPDHEGEPRPDRWALTPELAELAARWGIEPARDLAAGVMTDSLRGKLILAGPTLKDPNFDRTVVLITEHNEDGAMGLVLNRPSEATVGDAVPGPRLGRRRRRPDLRRRPGRAERRDRARRVGRPGAGGRARRGRPRLRARRRRGPRRAGGRDPPRARLRRPRRLGTGAARGGAGRGGVDRRDAAAARSCSATTPRASGPRCCGGWAASSRCSRRCRRIPR